MSHTDQETEQIAGRLLTYLQQQLDDRSITYDLPLVQFGMSPIRS